MLGIKRMNVPKSCSECSFKYYDEDENVLCCALEDGYISDDEADEKRLECCPLVETEERKVGKWIIDDKEFGIFWKCNCSNCKKDPQDYIDGSEEWWMASLPNYCPNCGAKMEVQE